MILSPSVSDPVSSSLVALLGVVFIPRAPLCSKRAAVVTAITPHIHKQEKGSRGAGLASSF